MYTFDPEDSVAQSGIERHPAEDSDKKVSRRRKMANEDLGVPGEGGARCRHVLSEEEWMEDGELK